MSQISDELAENISLHVPGCCWDDDAAFGGIVLEYISHLENEVRRLGGSAHKDWCNERGAGE